MRYLKDTILIVFIYIYCLHTYLHTQLHIHAQIGMYSGWPMALEWAAFAPHHPLRLILCSS